MSSRFTALTRSELRWGSREEGAWKKKKGAGKRELENDAGRESKGEERGRKGSRSRED